MKTLDDLAHRLASLASAHVMSLIAIYPSEGETGQLEAQGRVVESLFAALTAVLPEADFYRVLWSQFALVVSGVDLDVVNEGVRRSLVLCGAPELEFRAITLRLAPGNSIATLDKCLAEISSRRNFGKENLDEARRLVEGGAWAQG